MSASLDAVLREIQETEDQLVAHGDPFISRFGDVAEGVRIASLLGVGIVNSREARVVDRLRYFPAGDSLIREFLNRVAALPGNAAILA